MLLTNWKTTLMGFAAGGLNMLATGTNWKSVLFSIGLAAMGLLSKDHNVTGGTVQQPSA